MPGQLQRRKLYLGSITSSSRGRGLQGCGDEDGPGSIPARALERAIQDVASCGVQRCRMAALCRDPIADGIAGLGAKKNCLTRPLPQCGWVALPPAFPCRMTEAFSWNHMVIYYGYVCVLQTFLPPPFNGMLYSSCCWQSLHPAMPLQTRG